MHDLGQPQHLLQNQSYTDKLFLNQSLSVNNSDASLATFVLRWCYTSSIVKPYWVQSLWAFNVLIYIMTIWWGMFWWSGQQEWSYFRFLLLILYPVLLFLSASLIFPWEFSDDFDFEDHFYETRPWFFAVLAMAWCIDIPEKMAKSDMGLRGLSGAYLAFAITNFVLSIVAAFWPNKTYHKIFAVFWPVFTLGYLSITTLAQIAT